MIVKLTDEESFEKILKENKKVVVDFNATWCGPCRMMGRIMEDVEEEFKDITFLKVDTDDFMTLAQKYSIVSIPAFVAYEDGKRILFRLFGQEEEMHVGGMDEDSFRNMLKETFSL